MNTRRVSVAAAAVYALLASTAYAQEPATFKVAVYNIKAGKGIDGLPGTTCVFTAGTNCTDSSKPLNAWGHLVVQDELIAALKNDPKVIALSLLESWTDVCASPNAVRDVLGWKEHSGSKNGISLLAKFGFAGTPEWLQLDTSLNTNPSDTRWIVRAPVCVDAACSSSVMVYSTHWYGHGTYEQQTYEIQAQQTIDFINQRPAGEPQILLGDLNVWEGTAPVCSQDPKSRPVEMLREAGYVDAWPAIHGTAEGYTGMWNRAGCGSPEGYLWKRIDYGWTRNLQPVWISRFGMVPAGQCAPSDHAGLIIEYPLPVASTDSTAPVASLVTPAEGETLSGSAVIEAQATDDVGVQRVDILIDGARVASDGVAPYTFTWDTAITANGSHTIEAVAFDGAGNQGTSGARTVTVSNETPPPPPPGSDYREVVVYAADTQVLLGTWAKFADSTAADGVRVGQPDAGAAKVSPALASPTHYFELTFNADAGRAYRLWLRAKAERNHYHNDSVYVQFSGSVDANGSPIYRIGSTSAATVILEECSGCALSGWGWQDNGYGSGVLGPLVYFAASGPQTLRIQTREDGLSIDQVVLSAEKYLTSAPGLVRNDATILPETNSGTTANAPPAVTLTSPASGASLEAPATFTVSASASDSDGTIAQVEFFAGTTTIGTVTAAPYTISWTSSTAGSYTLTAVATDNAGARTTSSGVSVTVTSPNAAPTVTLTSPASGTSLEAPATFTVSASASDSDGTIAQVEFFAGTTTIGTVTAAPYTISWTSSTAGSYTLTAVATDNAGARTTSSGVSVTVTAPVQAISLTATGVKVKGVQRVNLTWSGATSANVDVFRDGVRVAVTPNDGAHTDDLNRKGSGTYVYRICEAGTATCSADRTVTF